MVLAETTGTGADPTIYYLHGLGLVAQSDGADTEYFAYDGLGSVRQVADSSGGVLLAQTFDPYGNPYSQSIASSWAGDTSFGFANEYTDATGLLYLRARYYAPWMGRFLNMDPSRQELNPYQYSSANPVMFTDPSGHFSDCSGFPDLPGDRITEPRYIFDSWIIIANATDFVNGVHPDDVDQNTFGNCYFAAAIAEIALQKPNIIENAIDYYGDGWFLVTFYDYLNGYQQDKVWVKPQRPGQAYDLEQGDTVRVIGPGDASGDVVEEWPLILENAYALYLSRSWNGIEDLTIGYQLMGGGGSPGKVFSWFTGTPSEWIPDSDLNEAKISELAGKHAAGELIAVWARTPISGSDDIPQYQDGRLIPYHTYYVTDINTGTRVVELRNPWGWQFNPIEINFSDFSTLFRGVNVNSGS